VHKNAQICPTAAARREFQNEAIFQGKSQQLQLLTAPSPTRFRDWNSPFAMHNHAQHRTRYGRLAPPIPRLAEGIPASGAGTLQVAENRTPEGENALATGLRQGA
jgi:hypothetical protein